MMRMQIMPRIRFWFHVSVFGFLTVPIFMYAFLFYMLEIKKNGFLTGYCIATVVAMGINVVTEVFIPEPDIIRYADGSIGYDCQLFICSCGGRCDRLYDSFGAQGNRQ